MRVGINAGFGEPIRHEFGYLTGLGFAFVRQDIAPDMDDETLVARVTEFASAPVSPLFLLAGGTMRWRDEDRRVEPHEIAALAQRVLRAAREAGLTDLKIEVGNEPDLAHEGYSKRPQDFAEAVRQTRDAARAERFTGEIVAGGISNLNQRGLDFLRDVVASGKLPRDITIGFHRYPDGDGPQNPHAGFASRDEEWAELRRLARRYRVACTEVGHHTAERRLSAFKKGAISDATAAEHMLFDLKFFKSKGCSMVAVYQLNDGPGDGALDRYGIRRLSGDDKPMAASIRAWLRKGS